MNKKLLAVIVVAMVAMLVIPGCAMFKAAKAPVKECLDAWKKDDFEAAFSYFDADSPVPYGMFADYAKENPIKKYTLNNISVSAEGTGTVKGSVTMKDGEKLGCYFEIVEVKEDEWAIWDMKPFSKDLLMED